MSLSQCHAEVVFELFQNGIRDAGGVLVGERAVVRAQLKAERNALLARCNAGAAVDIIMETNFMIMKTLFLS